MSIRRITAVLDSKTTKGNDRMCLIVLADKANDGGYCWPGLTHVTDQMNVTRQTALNCINRLEASGEIISERIQRKGSKYLVLTGLTDEQIAHGLVTYFGMSPDDAKETIEALQAKRNKSTNHTSNRVENLARLNTPNKSTNHTKLVYGLDQISLAARLDPSLPVIETSDSAEPKKPDGDTPKPIEDATPPAPAKPKRKRPPKTLGNVTPLQAVVAYRAFGVKLDEVISGPTMIRVNTVIKELRTRWQNGNAVTAEELKAAYLWHVAGRGENGTLTAPRDAVKVAAMVAEYRENHAPPAPKLPPADPDCVHCGGQGVVLPPDYDPVSKPGTQVCACRTEGVTCE